MKLIKIPLAILAIAATAATASATMTFSQYKSGSPLAWLNQGETYTSSFSSIKNGGTFLSAFLAANTDYEIISAVVKFGFADDGDQDLDFAIAKVKGVNVFKTIFLQGDQHNGNNAVEVDGSHNHGWDYHEGEIAEADFGALEDGVAEFKVKADSGDFWVKTAQITVTVDKKATPPPPSKVPDSGSTALLLGAALATIGFIRRKLA